MKGVRDFLVGRLIIVPSYTMMGTKVKNTWASGLNANCKPIHWTHWDRKKWVEHWNRSSTTWNVTFSIFSPSSSVLFLHPHAQISKSMKRNNYHHENKHRKTTDSSSINLLNATLTLFSCIYLVQNVILQCATFNWRTHGLVLLHGAKSMNPARVWLIMTHVSQNSANNPSLGNFWDLLTLC